MRRADVVTQAVAVVRAAERRYRLEIWMLNRHALIVAVAAVLGACLVLLLIESILADSRGTAPGSTSGASDAAQGPHEGAEGASGGHRVPIEGDEDEAR